MRIVISFSILTLLTLLPAVSVYCEDLPDVYMEEYYVHSGMRVDVPKEGITRSWISGAKLKQTTLNGQEVYIYRADLGKVFIVNPIRKSYIVLPISQIRQMTEKDLMIYMPYKDGRFVVPEKLYGKTGRTKTIFKWKADEYEVLAGQQGPEMKSKTMMWISKDTKFGNDFVVRIFIITMGNEISPKLKDLFKKMTALDGYPVQTITTTNYRNQVFTSTKTLTKIEKVKNMDQSIFDIPVNYTEVSPSVPVAPK